MKAYTCKECSVEVEAESISQLEDELYWGRWYCGLNGMLWACKECMIKIAEELTKSFGKKFTWPPEEDSE